MNSNASPWRFLSSLDAANPGDHELLKATRGDELELVRNMILSSRATVLYAFSGNGKSSLINAGIIPAFARAGFAVFRTRPRPALSVATPSQAFKDCVLSDFWIPPQNDLGALAESARALLKESAPDASPLLDSLMERANAILNSGQGKDFDRTEFRSYLQQRMALPVPEFVEEMQRRLGADVRMLFVLDQFEELFVHFYNTPAMATFVEELGQIYHSPKINAHLLFSMREDWVGSMVQLRPAIPPVLGNCFKLEPLRVSRAMVALTEPLKRTGVRYEDGVAERILHDLSQFYSVLQKQSFTAVHLTPSDQSDPYIELPAVQVLMDHLWDRLDAGAGSEQRITMKAYLGIAPEGTANPAKYFLENYLRKHLDGLKEGRSAEGAKSAKAIDTDDLRLDLLYLLTDRFSHRRAVSSKSLLAEVKELRASDIASLNTGEIKMADIEAALAPLVEAKFVRSEDGFRGTRHYELGHDFLVRSVIRLWDQLAERRAEERFRYIESQERGAARLGALSKLTSRIGWLAIAESLLAAAGVWGFSCWWKITGDYPGSEWIVLSLVFPMALFVLGVVVRSRPAVTQAVVTGVGVCTLWLHESWFNGGPHDLRASYTDSFWALYLLHLIVVSAFLATGVISWSKDLQEEKAIALHWRKIAAVGTDYAFLLLLMMLWGLHDVWTSSDAKQTQLWLGVFAFLWLASQGTSIVRKGGSVGAQLFDLKRLAEDRKVVRVWVREAVGQLGLLGFAAANWAMLLWSLTQSQDGIFSVVFAVFLLLHLGILGGFIWVIFRTKGSEPLVGRWSRTLVVPRGTEVAAAPNSASGDAPAHSKVANVPA